MRPFHLLQPLGWTCLLAMLALNAPGGIQAVRAEPADSVVEGAACDLDPASVVPAVVEIDALVDAARQQSTGDRNVVVLNNQGTRYGAGSAEADLQSLVGSPRAPQPTAE